MRIALAVVLLAGCASPALMQMQAACDSGNMQACETVLAHERAVSEAMFAYQPVTRTEIVPWPMMQTAPMSVQPQTTHCSPDYIGGFTCRAY